MTLADFFFPKFAIEVKLCRRFLRLEMVVVAERDADGRRCFVILDYLSNSVSSDASRSFRAPNALKTARYLRPDGILRGEVFRRPRRDSSQSDSEVGAAPAFNVSARVALERERRRLDPRFVVEGNENIYYGCGAGEGDAVTGGSGAGAGAGGGRACPALPDVLWQDPAEHTEVVELDIQYLRNDVLPGLRGGGGDDDIDASESELPSHAFTYPHDQHYSIIGAGVANADL